MTRELIIIIIIKRYTLYISFLYRPSFIYTNSQSSNFEYKFLDTVNAEKCSIKWICCRQTFVDDSIRGEENKCTWQIRTAPGYLFEIDWNRGGRAVPDCPENHFFKIAFAIHFRILFSLISLRILEIQLKKNWPRALFFFVKTSSKLFRP